MTASKADLDRLENAMAESITILAGVLAEAVGSRPTAYHLGASIEAMRTASPNPLRDRLLRNAYKLILIKALAAHSGDQVLLDLYSTEFGEQQKH